MAPNSNPPGFNAQGFLADACARMADHSAKWHLNVSHEQKEVARTIHMVYIENMLGGPRGETETERMVRENAQEITLAVLDAIVEQIADRWECLQFPRNEWIQACMGMEHYAEYQRARRS